MTAPTPNLADALAEVVAALDKAWQGEWTMEAEGKNEFGQHEYSIHISDGTSPSCETGMFYGDPDDAKAAVAAVNFLRAHAETIAGREAKYQALVRWYDDYHGTPCEQIRHRQEVEALVAERDALRNDIAEAYERMPMLPIKPEDMDAATDWMARFCVDFQPAIDTALTAAAVEKKDA